MKNPRLIQSTAESSASVEGTVLAERSSCSVEVLIHSCVSLNVWKIRGPGSPFWRLYFPLDDGAEAWDTVHRLPLKSRELYLIPPHSEIHFEAHRPLTKWYLHFTAAGGPESPCPGIYRVEKTDGMRGLIRDSFPDSSEATATSWSVIELISRCLTSHVCEFQVPHVDDQRVRTAIALMNESLIRKLTLADLSRECGLKERALNQRFLQQTGLPPIRYLMELRLNEACRLLRNSNLSVEEVAEQSGFANRFYLSRQMRKYRNTTPAQFRRRGAGG